MTKKHATVLYNWLNWSDGPTRDAFAELPLSEQDVIIMAQERIENWDNLAPLAFADVGLTKEESAEIYQDLMDTSEPDD
ncbi:hypothetical protein SBOR_8253 [Sclerotinia borealis F-4128]|uniref:Uncharacterized protein n=1 Tax=Sclerotinia borealis (strain F-4128) TaxID=1432307 RepID=W9C938_SCLBF|nr:hypothetical protein SBOR_8253 [Sclerotinia borealis F-4128]